MARPWDEVVKDERFQQLDDDTKEKVRSTYFDDVVAPNVPEASLEKVRVQFDDDTKLADISYQQVQYESENDWMDRFGQRIKRGWQNLGASSAGKEVADDTGRLNQIKESEAEAARIAAGEPPKDPIALEMWQKNPDLIKRLSAEGSVAIAKQKQAVSERIDTNYKDMIQRTRKAAEIPAAPIARKAMEAESFGDALDIVLSHPVSFAAETAVSSLPLMIEPIAKGIAGGAMFGPLGFAAGTGQGSFSVDQAAELTGAMINRLQEQNVDMNDVNAVEEAISDPEFFAEMNADANLHAATVGLFDALSAGIASKTLAPAGIKNALAREIVNIGAQTQVQGIAGAAPELIVPLIKGEAIKWGEAMAEYAGEFVTAPVDVTAATIAGVRDIKDSDVKKTIDSNEELKTQADSLNTMAEEMKAAKDDGAPDIEIEARTQEMEEAGAKFTAEVNAAFNEREDAQKMIKGLEEDLGFAAIEEGKKAETQAAIQRDQVEAGIAPPAMAPPTTLTDVPAAVKTAAEVATKKTEVITGARETQMQKAMREAKVEAPKYGIEAEAAKANITPTEKQKESGTYAKGHPVVNGIPIAIETPRGANRTGKDEDGAEWSTELKDHYGYIKKTTGNDGDQVDVFMTGDEAHTAENVFIVNQNDPNTGQFDEHKVVMGPVDAKTAKEVYQRNYDPGWNGFDSIVQMTVPEFKQWLKTDTNKKVEQAAVAQLGEKLTPAEPATPDVIPPGAMAGPRLSRGAVPAEKAKGKQATKAEPAAKAEAKPVAKAKPSPKPAVAEKAAKEPAEGKAKEKQPAKKYRRRELKKTAEGKLLGVPQWVKSPADVTKLRKLLRKLANEGEVGRMWYEKSGKRILDIVGGNKKDAERLAQLIAIYSPQNSIFPNMTQAVQAYYQYKAGVPREDFVVRPMGPKDPKTGKLYNTLDDKAKELLYDNKPWDGRKTNSFYQNLMTEIDPTGGQVVTADMWMARAFGYINDSISSGVKDGASSYSFIEDETADIANELGWTPHQAQAAIWVAIKARHELAAVREATIAESVKKGFSDYNKAGKWVAPTGVKNAQEHRKIWRKHALKGKLTNEQLAKSKYDFNDAVADMYGKMSWEARPSTQTDEISGVHDASLDQLIEYQTAMSKALTDKDGNDIIAKQVGVLAADEAIGPGVWEGFTGAGAQLDVIVPKQRKTATKDPVAQAEAKELLDLYANIKGLVLKQDGVAWHRPFYTTTIKDSNGMDFDLGRMITYEEAGMVGDLIDKEISPDIAIIPTPTGVRFLNFPDSTNVDNKDFHAKITNVIDQVFEDSEVTPEYRRFGSDGNMAYNDWKEYPYGQEYRQRILETGGRETLGWVDNTLSPIVQGVNSRFAKKYGWGKTAEARPEASGTLASPVPLSRLADQAAAQEEIYGRFGQLRDGADTTDSLKVYELNDLVENPQRVEGMLNEYSYSVKYFSFHEDEAAGVKFAIPKLKKEHYGTGVLWIYDPRVAHGSFKDIEYTRQWRIVHEAAHGITDKIMQDKYGPSRREGRLGRPWAATRGHPAKRQVTVELEPLTLLEAQRAIEWEDVAFRVQRMLMEDMGVNVTPMDFGKEYNTNIADATYRVITGDFGDPGEYGFVPRETIPQLKSILSMLEKTEAGMAKEQGRDATAGIDLKKWDRISQDELRAEMNKQKKTNKPMMRIGGTRNMTPEGLRASVNDITKSWKGAPEISVVDDYTKLPIELKNYVEVNNAQEAVDGLYDPSTGKVYLVGNAIRNEDHARKVILHEVMGHAGLRGTFGNDVVPFLNEVYKANREEIAIVAVDYGFDTSKSGDRLAAAEEWLAIKAETSPTSTWVQRLISLIKTQARRIMNLKMTNDEVMGALGRMRSTIIRGENPWQQALFTFPTLSRTKPTFYSQMEVALTDKLPGKGTGESYSKSIEAYVRKGVIKEAEVRWSGILDWLSTQEKLSKNDVIDYVKANKIEVQEVHYSQLDPKKEVRKLYDVEFDDVEDAYVVYDDNGDMLTGENGFPLSFQADSLAWDYLADEYTNEEKQFEETKYHDYQMEGGNNYREILIKLPENKLTFDDTDRDGAIAAMADGKTVRVIYDDRKVMLAGSLPRLKTLETQGNVERYEVVTDYERENYISGHFDEANILVHARLNERTDDRGNQVLFIEEIQSDWHQAARRGEDVPEAPFNTTWPLLAMKRLIRYAAENNFDKIEWTTGEQQAARYDLSKQIDAIQASKNKDGKYDLKLLPKSGREISRKGLNELGLEQNVGKELTKKIVKEVTDTSGMIEYRDEDLKVGGKGMVGFYDNILPSTMNKYVKKWGAKVQNNSVMVTDAMRASAMNGQPMFSRGQDRNPENRPESSDQFVDSVVEARKKTYTEKVNEWIDTMDEKIDGFSKLVDVTQYREIRGRTQALIQEGQDVSRNLYNTFKDLDEAAALNVFEYLTDRDASAAIIEDPKVRESAVKAKGLINNIGKMLVDNGLIPSSSYQNYESRYLPKVYLAYLLGDKAIKTLGAGKKLSKQGYAKKRDERLTKEYREVILGEIKDPAFLLSRAIGIPSRDLAIMEFFQKIMENPNWVLPDQLVEITVPGTNTVRQVTPYWLANEAERLSSMAAQLGDSEQKTKMLNLSEEYRNTARRVRDDESFDAEEYKQIPDTPQYGVLRGLIVKKSIYDDIASSGQSLQEDADPYRKIFDQGGVGTKVTQMWKVMKVAMNPPSQIRNLVSNWVLLNLSGVPWHKMMFDYFPRVISEMRAGTGTYINIAKEYGITSGTFSANELAAIEREFINMKARSKGGMSLARLQDWGSAIIDAAGGAYQKAEELSKIAKIMHEVEANGMEPALAAQEANKWLFDYSAVNPTIRTIRNAPIGAPFLTFYMKVLPRLLEVAATKPWRFAPYFVLLKGMAIAAAAMNDVDDDDMEKLKMSLPNWLRERGHTLIWPMKAEDGTWSVMNLGYFFPWTAWTDIAQDVAGIGSDTEMRDVLQGTGFLGSPVASVISALTTNIDPFTQKEVVRKGASGREKLTSWMDYMWTLAAPPWMTSSGPVAKMIQAGSGHQDRWGNPQPSLSQATARLVGVNIYPIDPMRSRKTNIKFMNYELDEIRRNMSMDRKDKNITAEAKRELVKDYKERIREKKDQIKKYKEQSIVHPKLK